MIHPLSDVNSEQIGENTKIWQYTVILPGARIGKNCNICAHCFIENDVIIGDNVTIKSGVYLWDGITIEDNVQISPNVTFTNDRVPRSKNIDYLLENTYIERGATIGAGATILCGLRIGAYAMVGAGAVVTRSIPARALAVGNPARIVSWLNDDGSKMLAIDECFVDKNGLKWEVVYNELKLIKE